jgi:hypothetical protein
MRITLVLSIIAIAMLFGSAAAEDHLMMLDHVVGELAGDRLTPDSDIEFHIRLKNNGTPTCLFNSSFAFQVYSPDGAEWNTTSWDFPGFYPDTVWWDPIVVVYLGFDQLFGQTFMGEGSLTGSGADSLGFAGLTMGGETAVFEGLDTNVVVITIHPTLASDGKTVCLDIAPAMSTFEWAWSALAVDTSVTCALEEIVPGWDGPHCYEVWIEKDEPPEFDNPPTAVSGSHCETLTADFDATDPDPWMGPGPNTVSFSLGSGSVGSINSSTGFWQWYSGNLADVGPTHTVWVIVHEADGPIDSVSMTVDVTNDAPNFTSGCGSTYDADVGDEIQMTFGANDNCPGDPMVFFVINDGGTVGTYGFAGGVLSFTPGMGDLGTLSWQIGVTDGVDTSNCSITVNVTIDEPPDISGPLTIVGSHCGLSESFTGTDPDGDDPVTFSLVTGVGAISTAGLYTYTGTMGVVGVPQSATIRAQESDGEYTDETLSITVTNAPPTFTSGCSQTYEVNIGDEYEMPFTGADVCPGDPMVFFVLDDAGATGAYGFVGGVLTYTPATMDAGVKVWTIGVTDDKDTSECTVTFDVTPDDPPMVTGSTYLGRSHCQTITQTYNGWDTDGDDEVTFSLISGVGDITPGGVYTFYPTLSDVGASLSATIRASEADGEYTERILTVVATNDPPAFSSGCDTEYLARSERETRVTFAASDVCPGDPMAFIIVDDAGTNGAYSWDGNELVYEAVEIDEGYETWTIGVTDGVDTSTCEITFEVFVGCCGLYTGGHTGNADYSTDGKVTLADIARMIDNVFISKAPLECFETGDINYDTKVTLADIAMVIDHVFISKIPMSPCP